MLLGFVFTNFNNSRYTVEAINSLARSADWSRFRICIVDNASREEEKAIIKMLSDEFPSIRVIFNETNVGYFSGLNIGLRVIREQNPLLDTIFIGNNDLEFPITIMEQLESCRPLLTEHPVLSPDIVTLDGVHQNPHVLHPVSRFRRFAWSLYYSNYYLGVAIRTAAKWTRGFTRMKDSDHHLTPGLVDQGFGACYLLGPVFFRHFREPWAPTFLMHEEYFFSLQLESKGYRVFYTPSIKILHHWHASVGSLPGRRIWELSRDSYKLTLKYKTFTGPE
ncbi:glycosyltransferase family 2 protein [Geothrix sp. PMB-07]|uniref:glycosyltransferase family 2 protein n=1 Tax=Geothrix sp. PMB-07 TaxID=3068640 RepID=UPI0035563D87